MLKDFKQYRKMLNVQRLAGTFKQRSYNLFEHSYGVLLLFKYFAEKEYVEYDLRALDVVIHHDVLESSTGDLIYTVKNFNDTTKSAWEVIEHEISKGNDLENYSDEKIRSILTKDQFLLFKWCDILDLWIFLKEEVQHGNRDSEVIEVLNRCNEIFISLRNRGLKIGIAFPQIDKFLEEYGN